MTDRTTSQTETAGRATPNLRYFSPTVPGFLKLGGALLGQSDALAGLKPVGVNQLGVGAGDAVPGAPAAERGLGQLPESVAGADENGATAQLGNVQRQPQPLAGANQVRVLNLGGWGDSNPRPAV